MNIEIERIEKDDWKKLSEKAHLIVFAENKPAEMDRLDYALVAKMGTNLLGYVTCRETDANSIYWQFGGAFPGTKSSSLSFACYLRLVWWTKQHYARVTTLIENTNVVYLKMALKIGFRVIGIKNFNGRIYLEHTMEFNK